MTCRPLNCFAASAALIGFMAVAAPVHAASITFDMSGPGACVPNCGSDGNKRNYGPSAGLSVSASAYSDTDEAAAPRKLETAVLAHYSGNGLAVRNRDRGNSGDPGENSSPGHATDNIRRADSILFDFGAGNAVGLNAIRFGWVGSDADFSVLASNGGALVGKTYGSLSGDGWSLLGNYAANDKNVWLNLGNANTFARYWLVVAYPGLPGSCRNVGGDGACVGGNDAFKLNGLQLDTRVPEPGTLALLGLGLAGLGLSRRRRT